jgi:cytochrome oxidase Cu insertion factor (SCO1/SenC/PrrC family)
LASDGHKPARYKGEVTNMMQRILRSNTLRTTSVAPFVRILFFGVLFVVPFAAATSFLEPVSAAAQDKILPLRIKVGEKAPDFSLPSADGKMVRLSECAGQKVLIDFYRGYW